MSNSSVVYPGIFWNGLTTPRLGPSIVDRELSLTMMIARIALSIDQIESLRMMAAKARERQGQRSREKTRVMFLGPVSEKVQGRVGRHKSRGILEFGH